MTKLKRKRVTMAEYSQNMDALIHAHGSVPDALIAMIQYSATVELAEDKAKAASVKPDDKT